jgi:hypothetical protein
LSLGTFLTITTVTALLALPAVLAFALDFTTAGATFAFALTAAFATTLATLAICLGAIAGSTFLRLSPALVAILLAGILTRLTALTRPTLLPLGDPSPAGHAAEGSRTILTWSGLLWGRRFHRGGGPLRGGLLLACHGSGGLGERERFLLGAHRFLASRLLGWLRCRLSGHV